MRRLRHPAYLGSMVPLGGKSDGLWHVQAFVCDARPFDRAALSALLASEGMHVAGTAADPDELLDAVHSAETPVLLIGSRVVRERGAAVIDTLHAANPNVRVLLVGTEESSLPARAAAAHADGFLRRDEALGASLKKTLGI